MKAAGMLFMSRTPPQFTHGPKGVPLLLLRAVHRIGPHQAEAWTLFWSGQQAAEFYRAHAADLTAGQPLQVELQQLRAHQVGYHAEIQARVESCTLLPRASAHCGSEAPSTQAEPMEVAS